MELDKTEESSKYNMIKPQCILVMLMCYCISCQSPPPTISEDLETQGIELIVLGTIQDAGSPQIGCQKSCCVDLWDNPDASRKVTSLGIVDHTNQKTYLLEATPDIKSQVNHLMKESSSTKQLPDAIFLTHAHIGHYSGLLQLGKEAINASNIKVGAMPGMATFLSNNGPWDQLIHNHNIALDLLVADSIRHLSELLAIQPLLVPHRDEYSETVGYKIIGPDKIVLFIPDIDKWHLWERNIANMIQEVDYAFLDATFYDGEELGGRDMSQIPHPSVLESIKTLEHLDAKQKAKVHFIHFNHTNPLLSKESKQFITTEKSGYRIAQFDQRFKL